MDNPRMATPETVLRAFVAKYDTQVDAAKALHLSQSYLTDLLRGRRAFSDTVLAKLGLKRIVVKGRAS